MQQQIEVLKQRMRRQTLIAWIALVLSASSCALRLWRWLQP